MTTEYDAKEVAILELLNGWPSQLPKTSSPDEDDRQLDMLVQSYQHSLEDVSAEAVRRSVRQFIRGRVERNNSFRPQPPEVAQNARMWDEAIATVTADRELAQAQRLVTYPIGEQPPPPLVPLGPTKIAFGDGVPIDMSNMSHAEKEEIMRLGGLPKTDEIGKIASEFPPQFKRM